jgi:lipopolysaccharide export system protein LptA
MTVMRLAHSLICLAAFAVAASAGLPAAAQEKASKMNGLALSNDKPIQIESDNLELRDQEKRALFDGNVKVVQGTMTLTAQHMIVYYKGKGNSLAAGGGDIDKIDVNDQVTLVSGTQTARGDIGSFDMRSEVLTLSGKSVVLVDGQNVLTGCKLTVQMKNGQANMGSCGGRVKILIDQASNKKTK